MKPFATIDPSRNTRVIKQQQIQIIHPQNIMATSVISMPKNYTKKTQPIVHVVNQYNTKQQIRQSNKANIPMPIQNDQYMKKPTLTQNNNNNMPFNSLASSQQSLSSQQQPIPQMQQQQQLPTHIINKRIPRIQRPIKNQYIPPPPIKQHPHQYQQQQQHQQITNIKQQQQYQLVNSIIVPPPKYQPINHHIEYQQQSQLSQRQKHYMQRSMKPQSQLQQIYSFNNNNNNSNNIMPVAVQSRTQHIQYQDQSQISQYQKHYMQRYIKNTLQQQQQQQQQPIPIQQIPVQPLYNPITQHLQYQDQSQLSQRQKHYMQRYMKPQQNMLQQQQNRSAISSKSVIPPPFYKLQILLHQDNQRLENQRHQRYTRNYRGDNSKQVIAPIPVNNPNNNNNINNINNINNRQYYKVQQQIYQKSVQNDIKSKLAHQRIYNPQQQISNIIPIIPIIPLLNKQQQQQNINNYKKLKLQPIQPIILQKQPILKQQQQLNNIPLTNINNIDKINNINNQQQQQQQYDIDVITLSAIPPIMI